ncbi:MAG: AAA family ATPase [Salinispira sp.]
MQDTTNQEFTFTVENLGVIREGEFTQKPLTIFCGPNNSGKTWAMYSLYNFYLNVQAAKKEIREIKENSMDIKSMSLKKFNSILSEKLVMAFNAEPNDMKNAKFHLTITETSFAHLLEAADYQTFLMPAERSGLHLFFRELSNRRTALLHHASKKNIDISELLRDVMRSRYAVPIADYIDWLNNMDVLQKKTSDLNFHHFAKHIQTSLLGGAYTVDKKTGDITFKPYKKRNGPSTQFMSLHLTSSTVKSLFSLWFYIKHQAKAGDVLMIDEPELNLHPGNQRKIARLLAQLVNAGLKVVISTHSDYIIREFNSLIMLSRDTEGELLKKHTYEENEVLKPECVGAWLFDEQTIDPFEISPDDGIYATTFDREIEAMNTVNNDIYYTLKEMNE